MNQLGAELVCGRPKQETSCSDWSLKPSHVYEAVSPLMWDSMGSEARMGPKSLSATTLSQKRALHHFLTGCQLVQQLHFISSCNL